MADAQMNSEVLNNILIIHVTENLISFRDLTSLLNGPAAIMGVVLNNKVPDYIPDQYSIRYLLDFISCFPVKYRKLAIVPFTNLQKAMFEIVIEEFYHLNVEINFFKELPPAVSWLNPSTAAIPLPLVG